MVNTNNQQPTTDTSVRGVFKLDTAEVMRPRLEKVTGGDISHVRERFHPKLLRAAGSELVPAGVLVTFACAVHDYTAGMPAIMSTLIFMSAPQYIEAIIGPSAPKGFLGAALDAVNSVMAEVKQGRKPVEADVAAKMRDWPEEAL